MTRDNPKRGHLFILSAPSGGGKTTLRRAVRDRIPDIRYSVSYTTRKPRTGEKAGGDYHFIDAAEFKAGIEKRLWAEWAKVHGCYYGTAAEYLERELSAGHDLLLDIDVQGSLQIVERYPDAITIFIMPPSVEKLRHRLKQRDTDSPDEIERRLTAAEAEMAKKDNYKHVIINDLLPEAIADLIALIDSYRSGKR